MRFKHICTAQLVLLMALTAAIGTSYAQALPAAERPNPAEALRRQQERQAEQNARLQTPVERSTEGKNQRNSDSKSDSKFLDKQSLIPKGDLAETPCFVIRTIELAGQELEGFAWVLDTLDSPNKTGKAALKPRTNSATSYSESLDKPIGQCLGPNGINIVVARAQDALIAKGYVTSRVLTAPQDISTGTLVLSLVLGRISEIRYDTAVPKDIRTQLSNAIPTQAGEVLNLRDLGQTLN